jgi:hypothetical protein
MFRLLSAMNRPNLSLHLAVALLTAGMIPAAAWSQRGEPMTETRNGTVVEIQEKGRSRTLVVDVGGEQQEYPLTPKVAYEVSAPGDAGFVDKGRFLSARGIVTNDKLFIQSVTIVLVKPRQKPPASGLQKAPMAEGESVNSWDIAGEITASGADTDYPDYTAVDLKISGRTQRVYLEPGFSVTVKTTDPTLIEVPSGTPIALQGTPRGERFILSGASVQLSEPLTAAEFFAEDTEETRPGGDKPPEDKPAEEQPAADKPADAPATPNQAGEPLASANGFCAAGADGALLRCA